MDKLERTVWEQDNFDGIPVRFISEEDRYRLDMHLKETGKTGPYGGFKYGSFASKRACAEAREVRDKIAYQVREHELKVKAREIQALEDYQERKRQEQMREESQRQDRLAEFRARKLANKY